MPPRPLTPFENPIANAVVELGCRKQWEFAAFLETPNGPFIEMRCLMKDDSANPSQDVHAIAASGGQIVVHHNHLSQESLSFGDWRGLATFLDETFAHCADGTRYWGRVLDRPSVEKIINCSAQTVEHSAMQTLFTILNAKPNAPLPDGLALLFRKEVINRAMHLRKFVEYECFWGTSYVTPYSRSGTPPPPGPAGILGASLQIYIDQAAAILAPTL